MSLIMQKDLKNFTVSGVESGQQRTWSAKVSVHVSFHPALQQAVESSVAEIEEATFGRGKYFDITDDLGDAEAQDVVYLRQKLHEDFEKENSNTQASR